MAKLPLLAIIPPVIFAGLAGLFYAGMQRDDPEALPSTFVGREAPALSVTDLGDLPPVTADALDAPGMKLVNFWASWCAPCRVEHPNLVKLSRDEGVPIYGINYKDQPDNALDFLEELGNPYAGVSADANGRTARDWGVYGVPETFVVDGEGRVVARVAGPVTERTLERTIRPALAGQ
ncbi:DsbE family thiol:disulfide interchange protein [Palleronia sp.]|uniref:DsbE family thiol:disulfide interchange protein n=1 Tax=Palleronia sp. TaxID=1940284 RepID=UPI0035C79F9B